MSSEHDIAISVRGLGKDYFLKRNVEDVDTLLKASVNTIRGRSRKTDILHAVQDMSFDVHEGEAVGLIGPNGAGKSTTLNFSIALRTQLLVKYASAVGSEVCSKSAPDFTPS